MCALTESLKPHFLALIQAFVSVRQQPRTSLESYAIDTGEEGETEMQRASTSYTKYIF